MESAAIVPPSKICVRQPLSSLKNLRRNCSSLKNLPPPTRRFFLPLTRPLHRTLENKPRPVFLLAPTGPGFRRHQQSMGSVYRTSIRNFFSVFSSTPSQLAAITVWSLACSKPGTTRSLLSPLCPVGSWSVIQKPTLSPVGSWGDSETNAFSGRELVRSTDSRFVPPRSRCAVFNVQEILPWK